VENNQHLLQCGLILSDRFHRLPQIVRQYPANTVTILLDLTTYVPPTCHLQPGSSPWPQSRTLHHLLGGFSSKTRLLCLSRPLASTADLKPTASRARLEKPLTSYPRSPRHGPHFRCRLLHAPAPPPVIDPPVLFPTIFLYVAWLPDHIRALLTC
jgi:hypothetical protein